MNGRLRGVEVGGMRTAGASAGRSALAQAAVAMRSQLSAQLRHWAAQSFIIWSLGSTRSQASAQARQTSAQSAQTRPWKSEARSMKPADVRQMLAQSIRSRMWDASAWRPPVCRQWTMVASHVA